MYRPFQQIAVTDWELCRFGRCKGYQAWEKDNLGKENASSVPMIVQGEKDMEAYVGFLAGLAVGERDCLGENQRPDILIVREKQLTKSQYIKLFVSLWETVSRSVDSSYLPGSGKQDGQRLAASTFFTVSCISEKRDAFWFAAWGIYTFCGGSKRGLETWGRLCNGRSYFLHRV